MPFCLQGGSLDITMREVENKVHIGKWQNKQRQLNSGRFVNPGILRCYDFSLAPWVLDKKDLVAAVLTDADGQNKGRDQAQTLWHRSGCRQLGIPKDAESGSSMQFAAV